MTLRVVRLVLGKRRHRVHVLLALPLIFAFNVVWALAEGLGHADALRQR